MWEKINKSVRYFFITIQFTLKTWKNSAEISKAYASSTRRKLLLSQVLKEAALWIFVVAVIGLLTAAGFYLFSEMKKKPKVDVNESASTVSTPQPPPVRHKVPIAVIGERSRDEKTAAVKPDSSRMEVSPAAAKPVITKYSYTPSSDSSDFLILVANKAVKSMYVLQKNLSAWRVVREYDIAIGEQEGRKISAGDKRTPEGRYFIVGRKEKSELASIYGPLAYVLNYPNEEDRIAGRTGQGIWIHGTDPDSSPYQTRGCLEMENHHLEELASMLKKGIGTPVIILNDPKLDDIASVPDYRFCEERRQTILREHERVVAQFRQILSTWKTAWERKNIQEYESFYDTVLFNGQGLTWALWKDRKLRTFGLYDTIAISIDHITINDVAGNSMIVKFVQQYRTNLNNIENGKKLSFEKINDFWKITSESTCPKEELLL